MKKVWKKMRSRKGQSLIEYALILALVLVVVIAALATLAQRSANTTEAAANATR